MSRFKFLIFLGFFMIQSGLQAQTQDYVNITPNQGNGVRFWNSDQYKIHMGSSTVYQYGPVTGYSIKMNMNDNDARGWTWGKFNQTPIAALNTQGNFQIAGHLAIGAQRVIAASPTTIAIGDLLGGDGQRDLVLRSGDQDRLKIALNGSAGLGTMTPFSGLNNMGLHIDQSSHTSILLGDGVQKGGIIQTSDDRQRVVIASNIYDDVNNSWSTFKAGKYAAVDVIGDLGEIRMFTSSTGDLQQPSNYLTLKDNGYVGVGTLAPESPLHVKVNAISGGEEVLKLEISDAPGDYVRLGNGTGLDGQFLPSFRAFRDTDNRRAITIGGTVGVNNDSGDQPIVTFDSRLSNGQVTVRPLFSWGNFGQTKMTLLANGSLGIGTVTTGNHKLAVEGSIGSREVNVEPDVWPDFVFEESYVLRDIEEVAAYIEENNHLPEVPSAAVVEEEGINLGEMNAKLLQKIEELTLYLIEQNKQNQALTERVEQLEKVIQDQKTKR